MRFVFLSLSLIGHWALVNVDWVNLKPYFVKTQIIDPVFLIPPSVQKTERNLSETADGGIAFDQRRSSSSSGEVFKSSSATLNPDEIVQYGNALPSYPQEAVEHGWQGTVILSLKLNSDGKVLDSQIVESSGFKILDMAAVQASREWSFKGLASHRVLIAPVKFIVES